MQHTWSDNLWVIREVESPKAQGGKKKIGACNKKEHDHLKIKGRYGLDGALIKLSIQLMKYSSLVIHAINNIKTFGNSETCI